MSRVIMERRRIEPRPGGVAAYEVVLRTSEGAISFPDDEAIDLAFALLGRTGMAVHVQLSQPRPRCVICDQKMSGARARAERPMHKKCEPVPA